MTRRNESIVVQQPSGTDRSSRGHIAREWSKLFDAWAKVRQLQDNEVDAAPQTAGEAAYEFDLLFIQSCETAFDRSCRILWRERIFNVVGIDNVESHNRQWLVRAIEDTSPRNN